MKLQNRPTNTTQSSPHLSATQDEDDELIQAIDNDQKGDDDMWELSGDPDAQGVENFWNGVKADLENDPGWHSFTNE